MPSLKQPSLQTLFLVAAIVSSVFTVLGVFTQIAQIFKPDSLTHPTKFELTDLVPTQTLVATLKQSTEPLASYLRSRFSTTLQGQLAAYNTAVKPDSTLDKDILDEINAIIEGPNIYDAQRFAGVILKNRSQNLAGQNPTGRRAVLLNRWLIEDAYYDQLKATPEGWWELVDRFNAAFGGWYVLLFFMLMGLSALFRAVFSHFQSAEQRISGLVEANSSQLQKARAFTTISDLYPPLTLTAPLQQIFRANYGGASLRGAAFHISASDGLCHITIQSEALYYSLLCSLCAAFANEVTEVWRTHILIPSGVAALFVHELVRSLQDISKQHRYYFFRNNFLDYDRSVMAGPEVGSHHIHLLSTFAKASRVLFQDSGANYGFLTARGEPTIWSGQSSGFVAEFRDSCERVRLKVKDNYFISAYVVRKPDTYEFTEGLIELGDDEPTERFFKELNAAPVNNPWNKAADWVNYPIEVALVSGEEMEAKGEPTVCIQAIDDYKIEGLGGGWLQSGNPRNLVWLKSVSAALKGARVERVFLVDGDLLTLKPDAGSDDVREIIELFKTIALQHAFFAEQGASGGRRGKVKVLRKKDCYKLETRFPDYWILTDAQGSNILGGVALQPTARYVNAHDQAWLALFAVLWGQGAEFPACFASVAATIAKNTDLILADLVKRNELRRADETEVAFRARLASWLGEVNVQLGS